MQIKDFDDNVLFDTEQSSEAPSEATIKDAVELAVRAGVSLAKANLYSARLRGADLRGARLQVSRTPSGTVDYDALQDIALAIEWDVRWLADADLDGTKYRARTTHIYCRPVCSGETDYPCIYGGRVGLGGS